MNERFNLTGKRFGRLTVISRSPQRSNDRQRIWLCLCDCGAQAHVPSHRLRIGKTESCGCLHLRPRARGRFDLKGKRFGRLTVIALDSRTVRHKRRWLCRCDCGTVRVVFGESLNRGKATSCGCLKREHCRVINADGVRASAALRLKDFVVGQTFGRLTVMCRVGSRRGASLWLCQCECGNTTNVIRHSLVCGDTRSCGCISAEMRLQLDHVVRIVRSRCYPNTPLEKVKGYLAMRRITRKAEVCLTQTR